MTEQSKTQVYAAFVRHGFKSEADTNLSCNGKPGLVRTIPILDAGKPQNPVNPVNSYLANLAELQAYADTHFPAMQEPAISPAESLRQMGEIYTGVFGKNPRITEILKLTKKMPAPVEEPRKPLTARFAGMAQKLVKFMKQPSAYDTAKKYVLAFVDEYCRDEGFPERQQRARELKTELEVILA